MTNRSKSCPPESRSGRNRRVELDASSKKKGTAVGGRNRKDDEKQDRDTDSQIYFIEQSSLQGSFSEPIEQWESKSNSDSSHTNLSETEASWLLAFDDIMSQVSSNVSGVDELLEVLSLDGEDPNSLDGYSITVETKNSPRLPSRKKNSQSKEDSYRADFNDFRSRYFACVDDFTIQNKFKCMDSSDFWETLRHTCSAHCDDTADFMEMLQAKSREKMEIISRFDSCRDASPILRTRSGRRVQFEFDMNPIPLWAQRSWRKRTGLHVIPNTNHEKASTTMQSCLKNPILPRSDGTSHPNSPLQGYTASTNKVAKQPRDHKRSIQSETATEDNAASRNSTVETQAESATATPQVHANKQNSSLTFRRKPKLKMFVSVAAVARKVLPLAKKSVVPREQVHAEMDGTEIEILALPRPSYPVPMDCVPHTAAPKRQGSPKPPDPPALLRPPVAPLAPTKPQQTRAVPKLQETPLVPSRPQVTPLVSPKSKETNSVGPKHEETPLRLRVEKVNSDFTPEKESRSKGSESSNNSTLVEDWSSNSSTTSEESAGAKYRLGERRSADPSGVYSPQKESLEGLTIECQESVESEEGQFDTVRKRDYQPASSQQQRKRDYQPASSQQPNRTNSQKSTKGKDIYSDSLQKRLTEHSQTYNTSKQLESYFIQEFNGRFGQGRKLRKAVQTLSSQPANAMKKSIARKHKSETILPQVAQQKLESGFETNNWFNFNDLDENGFPTNRFAVDP